MWTAVWIVGAALAQSTNVARLERMQQTCDLPSTTFTSSSPSPAIHSTNPTTPVPPWPSSANLDHLLLDRKHRLLYCYVPKVACTNWKRIMMILSDKWNNTDVLSIPATLAHSPGMFPSLSNISSPEREDIIENYTKLIFVRHPFERLLSAYRNKLEDDSPSSRYFQKRVGREIIKLLRPNASNSSLEKGNDVTFEEFVEFLTLPHKNENVTQYALNEHWEPISKLCYPCMIKYTIIGKYETLLDDSMLALNSINASYIPFPRDIRTSGTRDKLKKYYTSLPLDLIKRLYEVYIDDFRLFNYSLEDILGFELGL